MNKKLLTLGTSLVAAGALFTAQEVNAEEWTPRTVEDVKADLKEDKENKEAYEVKSGDILSVIAEAAGISLDSIVGFNAIENADKIYPGQKIDFRYDEDGDIDEVVFEEQTYKVAEAPAAPAAPAAASYAAPAQQVAYSQPAAQPAQNVAVAQTGSEASAKEWIAQRESGGSYTAYNPAGGYYGRYQLNPSLIHYGASAAEQEAAADAYVAGRYGSWTNAQAFWMNNGWY